MATHLTEEFIQKQKNKLEQDLESTKKEIQMLKEDDPFADPDHANDNAAVDSDVREETGHMNIEAQVKEMERRLEDINLALKKIEKGTYGICEKTNKPIPQARLELVPEARFAIDAV